MQDIKRTIIVIMLVLWATFLNCRISIAGIEEVLMPEAKILVKGKIPSESPINVNFILNDPNLNAIQIGDYVVWNESINEVVDIEGRPYLEIETYRETLDLVFALSKDGIFFFGCNGPLPDVLSVIGTFCVTRDTSTANDWRDDDGKFESKDIALVGMGYTKLRNLQDKGYITGINENIDKFRNSYHIEVKHRFEKEISVIYYPISIIRGNEFRKKDSCGGPDTTNWGVCFPLNFRWCPFASALDNGIAKRSCQISYEGEIASYAYCSLYNNCMDSGWIIFDDEEILRQYRCCFFSKKLYDVFPINIELGGEIRWSMTNPSIILTVAADSISVTDWKEDPSLGARRNPPPDILKLRPNVWYSDFMCFPENPKAGDLITFDTYSSTLDPNNEVLRYIWDFGDGYTAEGIAVTHTYSEPGTYTVLLDKIDNNERVRTFTRNITIISPYASEICYDGIDNDFDGVIDEKDCIACIFRTGIKASGQGQEHGVSGAYSVSTVYIGMDEAASTYKTPSAPPNWTVYMKVSGNLNEDIRQIGLEREEWVLTVDIGEYADPNLDGYYPVLSWDTNEFCAQVSKEKFRLYLEDTEGRLILLVDDMHKTNSYQTKAEEAECSLGMCRLTSYIIWSKDVLFEMNLPAGWTMISLPVKPESLIASDLFPDAEVIYGFAKGIGYDRVKVDEELEVGKGYWILLSGEQRYWLIGTEIDEYNLIVEDGWLMIGSCTSPSEAFIDKGAIDVIYGFNPSRGYQRVLASEKLKPSEGYWILFSDVIGQAKLTVKSM